MMKVGRGPTGRDGAGERVAARAAGSLQLGDHVCWRFDDNIERDAAVAKYVAEGLRRNHKVLYYTDAVAVDAVLDALARAGVPAASWSSGQVVVATAEDSYLATGRFDPDVTIAGWADESDTARAAGFLGLRVIGDMAWAARAVPGVDRLADYEAAVNGVFADGYAAAICLYDTRLVDQDRLRQVAAAHPATFDGQSDGQWAPLLRMIRSEVPAGLRLDGEIDMSNRASFAALLHQVCAETPAQEPVVIDAAGLRFADVATARMIARESARRPGGVRMLGASPLLTRLIADVNVRPMVEETAA